jgi:multidrug efflux pump subunit AcrB
MKALIKYFIKYPIAGNVLMILLIGLGYMSMTDLRRTFFPEAEIKAVRIDAVYLGASPAEIEEGIILKIEDQLDGLQGIDRITSQSYENSGAVTVEVESSYSTDKVLQDIKNTVDGINSFPSGMEPPSIYKLQFKELAISYAITGDLSLKELKSIARRVENELRESPMISQVNLAGFPVEEIAITVDQHLLKKHNISIAEIAQAIQRANVISTGGSLKTEEEEIRIRSNNKKYTGAELNDIVVKAYPNGSVVKVKDVATITDGWADVPAERYYNGQPAVIVVVKDTRNGAMLEVGEATQQYFKTFNENHENIAAEEVVNRSTVLKNRISLLINNGVIGFLLVFLFLSMFLHPRLALWVAIAIPVAFGGMFIASGWAGISINVISLFGMITVIGILVDDGIVIAENIYQHWERGKTPVQAAVDGTMEVLPAVFSAILTTIIAFSIFFVLDGIMGDFFQEMGFVVIATLTVSLVEGIFILPAHIAHSKALQKDRKKGFMDKAIGWFTSGLDKIKDKFYRPVLEFALKNNAFIVLSTVGFLAISISLIAFKYQKVSFFPPIGSNHFNIKLEMTPGTNEDITAENMDFIETQVWTINDSLKGVYGKDLIEGVLNTTGPEEHLSNIWVMLISSEERDVSSGHIASMITARLQNMVNVQSVATKDGGPFGRPISIALYSENDQVLETAKNELLEGLRNMGTLKDIETSDRKGVLELQIQLKELAKSLNISHQEIISAIREGFYGFEVQRFQRGLDEVKIWIRYEEEDRNSIGDLENRYIQIRNKQYLVKDLVYFQKERGVTRIDHQDGKKMVKVTADLLDEENSSSAELLAFVNDTIVGGILARHPEVRKSTEGQAREVKKVSDSFSKRGGLILLFMFITVALTFRSFSQTAAVFITSIFGFAGVVWGHYIHGFQLSLFSFFGMIALIGIMVNDALVLISALNINLKNGMPYIDALKKAALSRFRPILLTSATTVAGLAPLIFEKSLQAQFLIPMAIAIAYGLLMATFLTLVFLPSILLILNGFKKITHWLITGDATTKRAELEAAVKELKTEQEINETT